MDIDQKVRCMFYISKLKIYEIIGVSERALEIDCVDWFHFERSETLRFYPGLLHIEVNES